MSQLTTCGIGVFDRQSLTTRPDGSTEYDYNVQGVAMKYVLPPSGFDPATASPAQLAEYGVPPEPADPTLRQEWNAMIHHLTFVTPPAYLVSLPAKAGETDLNTSNWAGRGAAPSQQYGNTAALGEYDEPHLYSSRCSTNSVVYFAGMGGVFSSSLEQDGTGQNTPGLGQDQSWTEWVPYQNIIPQPLYATVGFGFEAYVAFNASGNDVQYYLYNYYTGRAIAPQATSGSGKYIDLSPVSFIAERPTVNGRLTNLSNFSSMTYFTAYAYSPSGNGYISGFANTYKYTMVNPSNGHSLAHANGFYNNGQSFTVTQTSCN